MTSHLATARLHTETHHKTPDISDQFRAGMSRLGSACTIITSATPLGRAGLTATAVCSVSVTPPRLLVCVNRNTHAHAIIDTSQTLAVNVLSAEQEPLARRFAGMTSGVNGEDKFLEGTWMTGAQGTPLLAGALVTFECRVQSASIHGTHTVFMCDVTHVHSLEEEIEAKSALLYFNRNFCQVAA